MQCFHRYVIIEDLFLKMSYILTLQRMILVRITLENRYAPEAVVQNKRKQIEEALTKLQSEVDTIKTDRDSRLNKLFQQYHTPLESVIAKNNHFKDKLLQVLNILKSPEGKIDANPTVIA